MSWLFTSCATPPASVPTAWSFWAWPSCSSAFTRSVTSACAPTHSRTRALLVDAPAPRAPPCAGIRRRWRRSRCSGHQHAAAAAPPPSRPAPPRRWSSGWMARSQPPPAASNSVWPVNADPLARIGGRPAVGRRGPDDLRGGGHERAVARLAPPRASSSARRCSVTSSSTSITASGRPAGSRCRIQWLATWTHRAVARLAGDLAVPLAVLQQDGLGLARGHRELGGQQLARPRRPSPRSADQPYSRSAPSLQNRIRPSSAARDDRRVAQDRRAARASGPRCRAERRPRRGLAPRAAGRAASAPPGRAPPARRSASDPADDAGDPERRRRGTRDEAR